SLIDPDNVLTMPGRLTGMLRAKWGLNSLLAPDAIKNRADHRHHAIDAAVIALTDRGTLKRVTDANRRAEKLYQSNDEGEKKLLKDFEPPWEGFHREMGRKVDAIVVSHKPDHSVG